MLDFQFNDDGSNKQSGDSVTGLSGTEIMSTSMLVIDGLGSTMDGYTEGLNMDDLAVKLASIEPGLGAAETQEIPMEDDEVCAVDEAKGYEEMLLAQNDTEDFSSISALEENGIIPEANEAPQGAEEELASVAEQLAGVEPAAGEAVGAPSGGGYGFESEFEAQGVIGLEDVGPIDPTQLQYGIEFDRDEQFIDDEDGGNGSGFVDDAPEIFGAAKILDETDGFSLSDSGFLAFDFGGNGGGEISANDDFVPSGSMADGGLHSGGHDVIITATPTGYTGTANGQVVFTFTIDPQTGEYNYNQVLPFDHADTGNPDDAIQLDFGVQISDSDGDIETTTVSITVKDDAPISIDTKDISVDETDLSSGAQTASGSVTVDFGSDGEGTITGNGVSVINGITSGGDPVIVTYDATTGVYTGAANGATVFTMTVHNNGDYDFTLIGTIDHPNSSDPNDAVSLNFGVIATDGDGDPIETMVQVDVLDDGPICVVPETASVDETNMAPDVSVSGQLDAHFGQDGAGGFTGNGVGPSQTLTSNGETVIVSFDSTTNTYTGVVGTETVFTLSIAADGTYNFVLEGTLDHPDTSDPNDVITLNFGVTARDFDGDGVDGTLKINVLDDGPVAHDDAATFDVSDSSVDGNVMVNDELSQDMDNTVTQVKFGANTVDVPETGTITIDGDYGTLELSANGFYTYTLNAGAGTTTSMSSFDPVALDVVGTQNSLTQEGITVSVANSGNYDLSWVDTADGSGIGIDNLNNGDSKKVWPQGETFDIDFDQNAQNVSITVAEIGSNNNYGQHGVDFVVTLEDGTTVAGEQQFVPSQIVDGEFSFALDASDFGGLAITSIALNSTNAGSYKGASFLLNNVKATYEDSSDVCDEFEYVLTDGDGDSSSAILMLKGLTPELIVGKNVDDTSKSDVDHHIGGEEGAIVGGAAGDILVGDVGGAGTITETQDYNFVFILDVSGSMGSASNASSRISLLKDAVENALNDFGVYQGGEIKIHITPFATNVMPSGTFTVTNADELTAAINYLDGLTGNGFTNYETPLQEANLWLQSGDALGGDAITTTYFISDGNPNRSVNDDTGAVQSGSANAVMAAITGADGSDEVGLLQSLSDDVIAIGVNASNSVMSRLDVIDEGGDALNIDDPSDLAIILKDTSPINTLDDVGDDVIEGGGGDDTIFGDSLHTDTLADEHGLSTQDGAGWDVFDRLENGESTLNPNWSRADTIEYIKNNHEALSQESVVGSGAGRQGGDDVLRGGDGNDVIYGQEGNDVIYGGAGNDILSGGSGQDTFVMEAVSQGVDVIKDFSTGEGDVLDLSSLLQGYDPTQQAIDDFVFSREVDGGTVLSVDTSGSGNATQAVDLVALEGLQNLDLQQLIENGNINIL